MVSKSHKKKILCPKCQSSKVVKNGLDEQRSRKVQRYSCKNCGKTFSSKKLKGLTFPPRIIMQALSYYNQGMTLEEASLKLRKESGVRVYPNLISFWLRRFEDICPFKKIRQEKRILFKKEGEMVFKKEFDHTHLFRYHKKKLELFPDEEFLDVKNYLKNLPREYPDKLFDKDDRYQFDLGSGLEIKKKESLDSKIADLALKSAKKSKEKYDFVEKFMLYNDSSTIAVEVPVWLYPKEVPKELRGILDLQRPFAGHVEILQLKDGKIHVLELKPNARKKNVASQLFAYSVALSVRTGKGLDDFRCAWFDDKDYYEFCPGEIVPRHEGISRKDEKKNSGKFTRRILKWIRGSG